LQYARGEVISRSPAASLIRVNLDVWYCAADSNCESRRRTRVPLSIREDPSKNAIACAHPLWPFFSNRRTHDLSADSPRLQSASSKVTSDRGLVKTVFEIVEQINRSLTGGLRSLRSHRLTPRLCGTLAFVSVMPLVLYRVAPAEKSPGFAKCPEPGRFR
jgi:hypothetical protein